MSVLLVQVPTSHLGAGEKVYPLGLSRLSSTIPGGMEKHALDMNLFPDPWERLKTLLEETTPDVITLSFRNIDPLAGHHASYVSSLKTAARLCRHLVPNARILAGGPAFSLFAQRLMHEVPQIDIGLKGEGERVFPQLLAPVLNRRSIPGILWREEGQVRSNPMGTRTGMDDIPKIDVRSFPPRDYTRGNTYVAAMGIEGKRGCDLRCGYCLYPFLGGARMRLRHPSAIVDEMEMLSREYKIRLFHFTDPVINWPLDHFEAICQALVQRKLSVQWTGFFREDALTPASLALAEKAGLAAIYFSGDALTDHGLTYLNKQMTKETLLNASRLTARTGMLTMCHFLFNLPGETDAHRLEAKQTLEDILDIHASAKNLGAVIFNPVRLYPGAPMTRQLIKSGDLSEKADLLYPVYHNPEPYAGLLHEFETICHTAGIFSRLGLNLGDPDENLCI